ncbi:LysM peptidoglycan-binding domain-containing protein [Deinococcus psychrotolerans]|uniref:LysM peptidoglycan-binding domain-containing protein n=1 Tax=Deinococcus psychrotolerans TaxID=2489213 RepID=A0A3G8YBE1_9DEIO|nr:peptidoglycan DD-metalloendopeptidase family protein [Deinococcus psychrotolerans]AZI42618.1 LysM peptidoglycan-binding domain-containing protein [Deinococcus psychrotolerans]
MKATLFTVSLALLLLGAAGAYTVKKGDTLYSLARDNNLKVEDLRRLNNLTSDNLALGQQLRLSTAERLPAAPPAASPKPAATPPSGFTLTPPPADPVKPTEKPVGKPAAPPTAPPTLIVSKALPPTPSSPPITIRSGSTFKVGDVEIKLPSQLSMGDAFIIKLTGGDAEKVKVSFPSELSEDVRQPNEVLTPSGAAGVYVVPGRVVLGKTTPVIVEIKLESEVVRGIIPLTSKARGPVVKLQLSPQVAKKLTDPGKAAEDAMVNKAYLNRGLPLWVKPFAAPLPNPVIPGSFGQSRTYTPGSPVTYHYGADFPAKLGSSIKAINDGTVVIAGTYPVRGGLVMIDHGGGISSLYFHQSKILVKVGQSVKRGDVIGKVGTSGISEGPHLHLEVRVRGEATNPADWIDRLWP